jgi:hypothetical protein
MDTSIYWRIKEQPGVDTIIYSRKEYLDRKLPRIINWKITVMGI